MIRNGEPTWGIIALICLDSFYFFSTTYIREQAYNFFFRAHVVAVILVLPAVGVFFHLSFHSQVIYADLHAQRCDTTLPLDVRCCIFI